MSYEQIKSTVETWIAQFGDLRLDEEGRCGFAFEDREVVLSVPPPKEDREPIFILRGHLQSRDEYTVATCRKALELNLYHQGTAGGSLAIDPETQDLTLNYCDRVNQVEEASFALILANFFQTMVDLHETLKSDPSEEASQFASVQTFAAQQAFPTLA